MHEILIFMITSDNNNNQSSIKKDNTKFSIECYLWFNKKRNNLFQVSQISKSIQ